MQPTPIIFDNKMEISADDYISTYRVVHEATSSSPSGRHVGQYKAVQGIT